MSRQGGQGAPLVPAFHAAVFGDAAQARAVLNLGGIANLTLLPCDPKTDSAEGAFPGLRGFDCGPGNALLDHWCRTHTGQPYDDDGRWAASGQVDTPLLATLLAEPWFRKPPPKSTGRDLFNADGLARALVGPTRAAADVQATLVELTARAAIDALRAQAPATRELLVCGGGAFNGTLMRRLAALWPRLHVATTAEAGLPPLQVEAAAFAWLARQCRARRPGNHPGVTGARGRARPGCDLPGLKRQRRRPQAPSHCACRGAGPRAADQGLGRRSSSRSRRWWWRWGS